MCSVPIEVPAPERAQWLAELAAALEEARLMLARLDAGVLSRAEAFELAMRIEAARLEVQSLRLSRSLRSRVEFDPQRMN